MMTITVVAAHSIIVDQ